MASTTGYRRLVVGTDGSATAELAVHHAATLAGAFGAELVIVSAFLPSPFVADAQREAPEDMKWRITDVGQAEDHAEAARDIAKQAGAKKIRMREESGDAAEALITVAEDTGADCIVVGSRGMSSASRFVLGSVPNRVSHHAPCDVLIVHTV
jgi:nucleotide-binding universal stress UspA family protein